MLTRKDYPGWAVGILLPISTFPEAVLMVLGQSLLRGGIRGASVWVSFAEGSVLLQARSFVPPLLDPGRQLLQQLKYQQIRQ
jgi:hypothetical protein